MKKTLVLGAFLGLLTVGSLALAVDSFVNPGFETGDFSGWTVWGGANSTTPGTTTISTTAYNGSYAARMHIDKKCQRTGVYQDVYIPACSTGDLILTLRDKSLRTSGTPVLYYVMLHPDQEFALNWNPDNTQREYQYFLFLPIHASSAWDWTYREFIIEPRFADSTRRVGVVLHSEHACGQPISPSADVLVDDFEVRCVSPTSTVGDIDDYIRGLPGDCIKSPETGRRNALHNKLMAVLDLIDAGGFDQATNKLQNDVLDKVDGWISCPDAQQDLYDMIDALITQLEAL